MTVKERLEGRISILAALRARQRTIDEILVLSTAKEEKTGDVLALAAQRKVPVRRVEEADLGAQGTSHGGMIAICDPKPFTSAEELLRRVAASRQPPFLLLIEGADDPRNLGHVLRSAEAFGTDAVLIRRRTWDLDATAVARASSGAYERLPLVLVDRDLDAVKRLRSSGLKLACCIPRARTALYQANLREPLILAIGGEKRGLYGAVRSIHDLLLKIPTKPDVSSLSMAQAAAVALAEVARQRNTYG